MSLQESRTRAIWLDPQTGRALSSVSAAFGSAELRRSGEARSCEVKVRIFRRRRGVAAVAVISTVAVLAPISAAWASRGNQGDDTSLRRREQSLACPAGTQSISVVAEYDYIDPNLSGFETSDDAVRFMVARSFPLARSSALTRRAVDASTHLFESPRASVLARRVEVRAEDEPTRSFWLLEDMTICETQASEWRGGQR